MRIYHCLEGQPMNHKTKRCNVQTKTVKHNLKHRHDLLQK